MNPAPVCPCGAIKTVRNGLAHCPHCDRATHHESPARGVCPNRDRAAGVRR